LLGAIVALHPTLQIDVVEAPTADVLTLLFEGEIAAALSGDLADMPERLYDWKLFEEGTVASIVVIALSPMLSTVVMQVRVAAPSTCTV
jgi:hypothetical protein